MTYQPLWVILFLVSQRKGGKGTVNERKKRNRLLVLDEENKK